MPDLTGHPTRVEPSTSHQPGAVSSSNKRGARRHARDFSRTSITREDRVSLSGRSTPRGPNVDKDLPRIPLMSTGLWDAKPLSVSSEVVASSPTLSHPPLPVSQNLKHAATTEAQRIATRYRRRYGSLEALRSEVIYPPELEVSSCLILDIFLISLRMLRTTSAPSGNK